MSPSADDTRSGASISVEKSRRHLFPQWPRRSRDRYGPHRRRFAPDGSRGFGKIDLAAGRIGSDARSRFLDANVSASGFKCRDSGDLSGLNLSAAGMKNPVAGNVAGGDMSSRSRCPQRAANVADRIWPPCVSSCAAIFPAWPGAQGTHAVPTALVIFPPPVNRSTWPSISCTWMFPPCVLTFRLYLRGT